MLSLCYFRNLQLAIQASLQTMEQETQAQSRLQNNVEHFGMEFDLPTVDDGY